MKGPDPINSFNDEECMEKVKQKLRQDFAASTQSFSSAQYYGQEDSSSSEKSSCSESSLEDSDMSDDSERAGSAEKDDIHIRKFMHNLNRRQKNKGLR